MDPQHMLVRMYLFVCRRYRGEVCAAAQRQSNNSDPDFTDREVLAIYLFGIAEKKRTVSGIYRYVASHFSEWFPDLPATCNGYLQRLPGAPEPYERGFCATRRGGAFRN